MPAEEGFALVEEAGMSTFFGPVAIAAIVGIFYSEPPSVARVIRFG